MSELRSFPKTFIRSLMMFHHNLRNAEKFLSDKRMSHDEKMVLKGWFLLRKNKVNELIEMILAMPASPHELVESQRKLLLGIAYNNLGEMNKAKKYLVNVPDIVLKYPIRSMHFIAYYNLCICYFNQKKNQDLLVSVQKMELLVSDSFRHEIMLKQCQLMSAIQNQKHEWAGQLVSQLDKNMSKMSESMKLGHLYDKFNYFLSTHQLNECLHCLWEMKKCRSFHSSENFNYMKALLEMLVHDRPLYFYPQQFKLNHSLFYQLKVVQSLQKMDVKAAEVYWSKLRRLDPETYLDQFQLNDEASLLNLALKKYHSHLTVSHYNIPLNVEETTKEKLLYGLLTQNGHPVSKEMIHQLIWNKPLLDKEDMLKLKKLVSRVRSLYHLDIKFKNGCYYALDAKQDVA